MSELPLGWADTTLKFACSKITDGTHHSPVNLPTGEFMYVTAKNIKRWGLDLSNISFVNAETHDEIYSRCPVEKGDVLYIKDGATTGLAIINPLDEPFSLLSSVALLKPEHDALSAGFLKYWLNSPITLKMMVGQMTGTAIRRLTLTKISSQSIALPPLPEQKRIVRKLDTLSAHTTATRTHLNAIAKLVGRYRDQVIKAAYSGRLASPNEDRQSFEQEGFWDLPESWEWRTIEDVAEIQLALTPVADIQELPHIAPDNIEKNTGRLLPYNTIAEDEVISAKHRFYQGQIVYSKIRPYLRKAILPEFNGACSADMYPVRPRDCCDIKYLFYWLLSAEYAYFTGLSEGRTVLPKINKKQMNASPIPWCPIDEQAKIVRWIEAAFRKIDLLASEAEKALKLTDRLDERILAKAFAGELVPQDPNEEPASVLLDRIREERATTPKQTRRASTGRKKASTSKKKADEMNDKKRSQVSETHLSSLLKKLGGTSPSRDLWLKSEMDLNEFYMLLRDEVSAGRIDETQDKRTLVATNAA
ncbi:restriction endonuclease subunit S [Cognatiyoonia sp. IB215446]|uniref:restriction endonuclease subunit S n=1 Tax=Cognatiyoonia sp. IB215446 TaxID=3097355 RepID=UPI002A0DFDD2|nr:restriction endonuclease subunit S [Cognatiyoonia sp. IB215446]MDX8347804.1 restriction endonuclease subunit S [Cognatiyoonia sp. IB215446]